MTPTATPVTYGLDSSIARFSVARYQRMVEAGILTSEDKVELLENYVVLKMPRNPPTMERFNWSQKRSCRVFRKVGGFGSH